MASKESGELVSNAQRSWLEKMSGLLDLRSTDSDTSQPVAAVYQSSEWQPPSEANEPTLRKGDDAVITDAGLLAKRPSKANAPEQAPPSAATASGLDEPAGSRSSGLGMMHAAVHAQAPADASDANVPSAAGRKFHVAVTVTAEMKPWSHEKIFAEVKKLLAKSHPDIDTWTWEGPKLSITDDHVTKKRILVPVTIAGKAPIDVAELESSNQAFQEDLEKEVQRQITQATNELFWELTGYEYEQMLKKGNADDEIMMKHWLEIRHDLIQQRIAINALPRDVRDLVMPGKGRAVSPKQYQKVLEVAAETMKLSAAQRKSFANRVVKRPQNLDELKVDVTRFSREGKLRTHYNRHRESAKNRLLGTDEAYRALQSLKALKVQKVHATDHDPFSRTEEKQRDHRLLIEQKEKELNALLNRYDFDDIDEFQAAVGELETTFEKEAVMVSREMLDRSEHQLLRHEESLNDGKLMKRLFRDLGTARKRWPEYEDSIGATGGSHDPNRNHAKEQFHQSVTALVKDNELMAQLEATSSKISFELAKQLATAKSEGELRQLLLKLLKQKRTAISATRKNIALDPKLVWRLDQVRQQTKMESGIEDGKLLDLILADKIKADADDDLADKIKLAIIAIVAGLVSGGGGTVAVLGATVSAGIGGYEALEEYRRYEIESTAHDADLLSQDPSFAWVIVALAGAGFDAAGIAAALRAGNSVGDAVRAFSKTKDQRKALTQLEKQLQGANADVKKAILKSAKAEAAATAVWQAAKAGSKLREGLTSVVQLAADFAYPAYLALRRGVLQMDKFLKMKRVRGLIGKLDDLSPEDLVKVKKAYEISQKDAIKIQQLVADLKLQDTVVDQALATWLRSTSMSADDFMKHLRRYGAIEKAGNEMGGLSVAQTKDIVRRARELNLDAEALEKSISSVWRENPKMSAEDFVDGWHNKMDESWENLGPRRRIERRRKLIEDIPNEIESTPEVQVARDVLEEKRGSRLDVELEDLPEELKKVGEPELAQRVGELIDEANRRIRRHEKKLAQDERALERRPNR